MNKESFDDIIKRYAEELEFMGRTYGGEEKKAAENPSEKGNEPTSEKEESNTPESQTAENDTETEEINAENSAVAAENADIDTEPAVKPPLTVFPQGDATSFASFSAAVFSGEGTYPVEGARVVVYRGDNIYAFLETDENGTTKSIRLPAFEKENSLEADNPQQSIEYLADVFAEGFISQKELVVSSVGGSDILLRVLMIPESERIG